MRISFLTTWDIRCGIAEYSKYFVSALSDIGLDIRVIKLDPLWPTENIEKLIRKINEADVAHIQYEPSFFTNYALNRFIQAITIPKIITMHEEYPATNFPKGFHALNPYYLGGYFYRIYLGKQYYKIPNKIISKFIVHSDNMKKSLRTFGVATEKIEVFPLPVPSIGKTIDIEKSKSLLSLSNKTVLTIFGFINSRKGYEIAVKALCGLPKKCVLLIAGGVRAGDDGRYMENLKQQITRAGLSSRVICTGFLRDEEIPLIMSATDIVLAPFTKMSNSGSLSVAISYGKAVIASDLTPNRKIYDDGKCLALFKSGSSSDLKRTITALTDNKIRKSLLENAAFVYAENYSYLRMAKVLHSIYRQILRKE